MSQNKKSYRNDTNNRVQDLSTDYSNKTGTNAMKNTSNKTSNKATDKTGSTGMNKSGENCR